MLDNVNSPLAKIKIVLVGTTHSGNIGSAARAMKVMGLSQMVLVAPECKVDGQAIALAAGASEIANNARIVATLEDAVADCSLVVGTSSRSRTLDWPMLDARECGLKVFERVANLQSAALVFGRERNGLNNQELQLCHYHVAIPANPDYCSLNLAMAVQLLCYEIRMAYLTHDHDARQQETQVFPQSADLERFYQHLQNTLYNTGFINPAHPGFVMAKLRRLFTKAQLDEPELNILRGVLSSVDKASKKNIK
ncbi:MAG: tRNA (cytosine(32)/uridine(32)-2'-O)-methyltransferase TrmJ [Vibrionaceae bacterium]